MDRKWTKKGIGYWSGDRVIYRDDRLKWVLGTSSIPGDYTMLAAGTISRHPSLTAAKRWQSTLDRADRKGIRVEEIKRYIELRGGKEHLAEAEKKALAGIASELQFVKSGRNKYRIDVGGKYAGVLKFTGKAWETELFPGLFSPSHTAAMAHLRKMHKQGKLKT